jgi:hypothetical protein
MAELYTFPGGYEVNVFKKQDILDCIDKNIVDKEIALAIVEQCELDAANFLREGRWTGIPFIGNIRVPKIKAMEATTEQQAIIEGARETLDTSKYVLFRRQLSYENSRHIKQERYYKYITSIAVTRNKKLYKKLCNEKGEYYARIFLYASKSITSVDNEYVTLEDYEQ